jgi:hypothetical protein
MILKKKSKFFKRLILIIILLFAISIGYSFHSIFRGVKDITYQAKSKFGNDNVQALISLANSNEFSFKLRNRAIWALGQIGDKRALPTLNRLNSKIPQTKQQNPNNELVRYTIEKSINQINCNLIVTRWMYYFL